MFGRKANKEKGKLVYAVLPAAGSARRMGGTNKLLLELCGKPVIQCTLEAFDRCEQIDGIVLCCRKEEIQPYQERCRTWGISKPVMVVEGGESRAHSVYQGVLACPEQVGYVAIHDAARPFITPELIGKTVETAKRDTAAALAVPVKDSIKRIKDGRMVENVDRDSIVAVQTPQAFDIDLIRAALCHVLKNKIPVTDDCGAVEAIGQPSTIVQGDYNNIKITTVEDIAVAEQIWKGRAE